MTILRCFCCGGALPQPDWVCEQCGRYNCDPASVEPMEVTPRMAAAVAMDTARTRRVMANRFEFPGLEGPEFELFPGESAEIGRRAP